MRDRLFLRRDPERFRVLGAITHEQSGHSGRALPGNPDAPTPANT
jgi:hypothetical protein